jgi:PadR family transcriptional regulator PadR
LPKEKSDSSSKRGTPAGIKELLKKATTEMLVLFLLRQKPMYTYEMMQKIEKLSNGILAFNTLYIAIYRLEKYGYLKESGKILSEDNRIRIYFSITEEGREYLKNIIAEYRLVTDAINNILSQDGTLFQEGEPKHDNEG